MRVLFHVFRLTENIQPTPSESNVWNRTSTAVILIWRRSFVIKCASPNCQQSSPQGETMQSPSRRVFSVNFIWAALSLIIFTFTPSTAHAQGDLNGVIDFHVHSNPD